MLLNTKQNFFFMNYRYLFLAKIPPSISAEFTFPISADITPRKMYVI
jgi:hypothetical protein